MAHGANYWTGNASRYDIITVASDSTYWWNPKSRTSASGSWNQLVPVLVLYLLEYRMPLILPTNHRGRDSHSAQGIIAHQCFTAPQFLAKRRPCCNVGVQVQATRSHSGRRDPGGAPGPGLKEHGFHNPPFPGAMYHSRWNSPEPVTDLQLISIRLCGVSPSRRITLVPRSEERGHPIVDQQSHLPHYRSPRLWPSPHLSARGQI
ncbi:hypothetical protein C7212DRAFT_346244 [Tuber magnatum]|uniref:Uncharacterized protein n=1 Tax=Tuber magnatum TaxID=42249 RepID=A0A317SJX5_9PEZI|nr:hypothetical protein C7212DRAFT_346244 [Tuber magnatum]